MNEDGGPAFPANTLHVPFDDSANPKYLGISTRDYFAAKAMQALITGRETYHSSGIAQMAYKAADAMLEERAK